MADNYIEVTHHYAMTDTHDGIEREYQNAQTLYAVRTVLPAMQTRSREVGDEAWGNWRVSSVIHGGWSIEGSDLFVDSKDDIDALRKLLDAIEAKLVD